MDRYQDEIPQGFDRIPWGDLTTMFHPIELDKVWKSQQNWNIVSWKLHNSYGMLKGLSVAGKCALWFGNLEARNGDEKGSLSVGLSLHNKWSSVHHV
ncbi:hypothetical protein Tco_0439443 [Tanacetum coccineum]